MKLINYLKSFLYFLIPFLILIFITTIFYYYNIISNNTFKYLKIAILLISTFYGGYNIGKLSIKKGYLNGIILSLIIIFIFFLLNIIISDFKWQLLIYYLIIMIITTLGSMIGMLKKVP